MNLYRIYTEYEVFDIWADSIEEVKKEVNSKIVDIELLLNSQEEYK